jgi:glycosyltransferase involved in cell wall biosynthesis
MTGAESADDLADAQRNCTLEIFRQTDAHWERGILRNPGPHYGAVIGCIKPARTPEVGDILRLRSGRLITICKVEERGKFIHLSTIEGMNSQSDGFPNVMIVVSPADLQCDMGDGGSAWDAGVWQGEGPYAGRCIVLPDQVIADCGDEIDQLSFIRSDGSEVQVEKIWSRGGRRIAWLRERAGPNADPKSFAPSSAGLRVASRENIGTAEPPEAWREADRAGRVVFFEAQARLSPGQAIVFGGHDLRHVLAQQAGARGTWVLLNMAVARSERKVRFATAEERAHFAARQLRHRSPIGLTAPGKLGRLIESYRRSQPIVPMSPLDDRPRVLFTSIVPPDPADQGNRIVTRNFIKHILTLGFDVDLLLIGAVASERIFREFGDRVRVFSWPFPDWASEPSVAARLRIAKELREAPHASSGADYFRALLREASTYHPFFIVPDPLIRTARALYCKHDYQAIVCNYTHMIRVACELEPIRPLPPVAIVTHDALSRLPLDFEGTPIDTGYRLCSAEIERDVLNAVPGALVLAISKSEQHYFREIGVSNPIELCEYDGLQECDRYRVMPAAFAGKRLLFHASGNPMNKVAIDWFLQNCWATVRRAVPDAKLVICGKISAMVDASIPGLEVHGVISRNRLMEILGTSTLAINPTLVGTGLKIKTVEACCAGLPSVCLPAAIEGLEDVASRFCALEEEPDGFAAACIRLLTDPDHWKAMRDSSLAFAAERFSEATIYGPVDRYLGWHEGIEMRHARLRLPYEPDEPRPLRDLVDGLPEVGREMKQLLLSLLDLGEIAMAASILAKLHDGALPGDVALCNAAVEFALASDNLQMARHAALSAIATDPADLSALVQLLWVALRTNDIPLANETWDYLSLAAPGSRGTAEFAKSHGLERWQAQAAQWAPFPLDCRISGFNWVSDFVPIYGRLGPGWSPMESWGAWSDGPYARLNLRFESRGARLKFRINGTAQIQGVEGERIVRILADSKSVGQFSLPLDAPTCQMEFDIAAADLTVQGELVIEFLIQNPGPARHEDSSFSDGRLLGFALQSIEIDEVSEAIEAAA